MGEIQRLVSEAAGDPLLVARTVTRAVAEQLGNSSALRLLSADGRWLEPVASYHRDSESDAALDRLHQATRYRSAGGPHGYVVQSGQPLLISDVTKDAVLRGIDPSLWPYVDRLGTSSLALVPIREGERVIGTLGASRSDPGDPYDEGVLGWLQEIARLIAPCLVPLAGRRRPGRRGSATGE